MSDLFPGSDHVYLLDLGTAEDRHIRIFATENDFIVVTKDADYGELHSLFGGPPKVIWIKRGNCSTDAVEQILRDHFRDIAGWALDTESGVLTIY